MSITASSKTYCVLCAIFANFADAARRFGNDLEQLVESDAGKEQAAFGGGSNVTKDDFFPLTPVVGLPPLRPTYRMRPISPTISTLPRKSSPSGNPMENLDPDAFGRAQTDTLFPYAVDPQLTKETPAYVLSTADDFSKASMAKDNAPTFALDDGGGDVSLTSDDELEAVSNTKGLQKNVTRVQVSQKKEVSSTTSGVEEREVLDEASPFDPFELPCAWMVKLGSSSKYIFVLKAGLVTGALGACKICLHNLGYGETVQFTPLLASSTGATTFLNGFVLAALIADFKEAEKIVSEITGCLENVYQTALFTKKKGSIDMNKVSTELESLATDIMYFLGKNNRTDDVFQDVFERIYTLQDLVGPANSGRVLQEASTLNKLLIRASHIKNVDFIPAAFAIVEVVTFLFAFGTLVLRFDPFYSSLGAYCVVLFVFVYLNLFYSELDEAFGPYPDARGECDVGLYVLDKFREQMRIQQRKDS